MKTIYIAQKNADGMEGRGPMIAIGHFTNFDHAKEAAKGKGVVGVGDGEVKTVILFDSFQEYNDFKNGEVAKQALAKLTAEEKLALGINEKPKSESTRH